jgi:hypothetical protein
LFTAVLAMLAVVSFAQPAAASPVLAVYGPDSISASGNYTYYAYFDALYPSFQWATRTCNTASVDTCTTTWSTAIGTYYNPGAESLTEYLTARTCSTGGQAAKLHSANVIGTVYTYQVRVIASGFAQPAQTVYKVTNLCVTEPL